MLKYPLNVSPMPLIAPRSHHCVHPYGHLHQSVDRCPIARIRAHSQSLIVSLNLWKTVHLRCFQSLSRLPFKLSICQLPHRRPLEKGLPPLFSRQCTPHFQPHFHVYQSATHRAPFNSRCIPSGNVYTRAAVPANGSFARFFCAVRLGGRPPSAFARPTKAQ